MLATMEATGRRPLRWQIADRFSGRRGRRAILALGGLAVLLFVWLMMLRSYEGRPLLYNPDGVTVMQTQVVCPPARKALTASFKRTDPTVPVAERLCIETGRAKGFTTLLFGGFVAAAAFGLSRLPDVGKKTSEDSSKWDDAIANARRRQSESGRGPTA